MHRLFFRTFISSLVIVSLACASDEVGDAPNPSVERATTYYVVRHTERDSGVDPPINEEGQERAERLADALEYAGVDEIITTQFLRGQQSGRPLSDRTGAPITIAPFEPTDWPDLARDVAEWQLEREVQGSTYLMIGHASTYNTTLLLELGAPNVGTMAERYQDIATLVREPDGSARLSLLEFGGPSSLDP